MKKRCVITVDGLLATGKTALAKALASELGFVYLSTGMLYRGVGYLYGVQLHNKKTDFTNAAEIVDAIKKHSIKLTIDKSGEQRLLIDDKDVTDNLFDNYGSRAASLVGQHPEVREALYDLQRNAYEGLPIVAEGRDMGSVVFPDAELKFFIEVDAGVKVERRFSQLYGESDLTENEAKKLKLQLEKEIIERDARDTNRSVAPTVVPKGAYIINNSHKPLTQVVKNMYDLAASQGLTLQEC